MLVRSSKSDRLFDTVVGHIEDIIIGQSGVMFIYCIYEPVCLQYVDTVCWESERIPGF